MADWISATGLAGAYLLFGMSGPSVETPSLVLPMESMKACLQAQAMLKAESRVYLDEMIKLGRFDKSSQNFHETLRKSATRCIPAK